MGGDVYRNFFGEAPFGLPSPRSASAGRIRTFIAPNKAPDAPSGIANCVIRRKGAEASPCSTSPLMTQLAEPGEDEMPIVGEIDCSIRRGIW
jgi:hypothetical protein